MGRRFLIPLAAVLIIAAQSDGRTPNPAQRAAAYPEKALRMEQEGRVVLDCRVASDRTLTDCRVAEEAPEGFGFGEAALKLTPTFRAPARATQGEMVKIPFAFVVR